MRAFACLAIIFFATFCHAIEVAPKAVATPTPTNLDIILEGPWLLYVDSNLFSPATVLVALSPDVSNQSKSHTFHYPYMSMGDGYPFKNDIYCLLLDGKCGSKNSNKGLVSVGYDSPVPLMVHASQSWNWRGTVTRYGSTALILPMPDTYSNDETWPMHFAKTFGTTYGDNSTPNHSIGLLLHYVNGISTVDMNRCDFSDQAILDNCILNIKIGHQLNNTGTLRIVMKAPDDAGDDVCDVHVRNTYPQMLQLVDGKNDDIGVIDPARQVKADESGDYDDHIPKCFMSDPQDPNHAHPSHPTMKAPTLKAQLGSIITKLGVIAGKIHDDVSLPSQIKEMGAQIGDAAQKILNVSDGLDDLPRLSQLAMIRLEVQSSAHQMETLTSQLDARMKPENLPTRQSRIQRRGARKTVNQTPAEQLLNTAKEVQREQRSFLDGAPTKDGKDCRAPLMLVTQP